MTHSHGGATKPETTEEKPEEEPKPTVTTTPSTSHTKCLLKVRQSRLGLWCLTSLSTVFQISWLSVLLMKETRVPRGNHRPVASH